jgi:hypothetical protein
MKRFSMTCTAMEVSLLRAVFLSLERESHNHLLLSLLSGENESEEMI